MTDNAAALARWQYYQTVARQMGLVKSPKPATPQPRSLAEAIYPNLPSSERE